MSKLYPWPARWPVGIAPSVSEEWLPDPIGVWQGDFVYRDPDTSLELASGSADLIYGLLAEWPYETGVPDPDQRAGSLKEDYVLVYRVTRSVTFAIEGSRAPVEADIGNEYGLDLDHDGFWMLDLDDTVFVRAEVVDVSIPRGLYFIKILSDYIQE